MTLAFTETDTPVGRLLLAGTDEYLSLLWFQSGSRPMTPNPAWRKDERPLRRVVEELRWLLRRAAPSILLVAAAGRHGLSKRVWKELQQIPYGDTISYGQLAERIGNPKASRAVGREWSEPNFDHRAMPSSDRRERKTDRLWRRIEYQREASGAGAQPATASVSVRVTIQS